MTPDVGTELINPRAGTTLVFVATAASTGGAYVELEATYPPNSHKPPLHLHPSQTELFTIVSGGLDGVRGDDTFSISAGDELTIASGVPHQMWATAEGATFRWRTTPALRTDEMQYELWRLARDSDWKPDGMKLFELVSRYDAEFCLC